MANKTLATIGSFIKNIGQILKQFVLFILKHPIIAIVVFVVLFAGSISIFHWDNWFRAKNPSVSRISVAQILPKSDLVALTIDYDVLVDTTRSSYGGVVSQVVRVYHANVLLGFNFSDVELKQSNDTVFAKIPKIRILNSDENVINDLTYENVIEEQSSFPPARINLTNIHAQMSKKANTVVRSYLKADDAFSLAAAEAKKSIAVLLESFGFVSIVE